MMTRWLYGIYLSFECFVLSLTIKVPPVVYFPLANIHNSSIFFFWGGGGRRIDSPPAPGPKKVASQHPFSYLYQTNDQWYIL